MEKPLFIINSVAPIRICDNGGWTDTWFAGHGQIFNIGVYPYAEVQIAVYPTMAAPARLSLMLRIMASAMWSFQKKNIGISTRCSKRRLNTCACRPAYAGVTIYSEARAGHPPALQQQSPSRWWAGWTC